MSVPHRGRLGPRSFLRGRTRCTSLEIFCTDRIALAQGFVTALTKTFSGSWGGRYPPDSALASILARPFTAVLAGECPLYARAIVILFWPRMASAANSLAFFPCFQFTNRRILTFITMPSARNINRTEDPP
jgi:hypothetical protein